MNFIMLEPLRKEYKYIHIMILMSFENNDIEDNVSYLSKRKNLILNGNENLLNHLEDSQKLKMINQDNTLKILRDIKKRDEKREFYITSKNNDEKKKNFKQLDLLNNVITIINY